MQTDSIYLTFSQSSAFIAIIFSAKKIILTSLRKCIKKYYIRNIYINLCLFPTANLKNFILNPI